MNTFDLVIYQSLRVLAFGGVSGLATSGLYPHPIDTAWVGICVGVNAVLYFGVMIDRKLR